MGGGVARGISEMSLRDTRSRVLERILLQLSFRLQEMRLRVYIPAHTRPKGLPQYPLSGTINPDLRVQEGPGVLLASLLARRAFLRGTGNIGAYTAGANITPWLLFTIIVEFTPKPYSNY